VVADADYRPFPSALRLRDVDGALLQPTGGAVLVRLAQRQLEDPHDPGHAQAEERLEYLRRNFGELMYDLRCRRGHVTLATMPGIIRAMRRTSGRWVSPR
jgi:N-formylglutamate amidohydrolase